MFPGASSVLTNPSSWGGSTSPLSRVGPDGALDAGDAGPSPPELRGVPTRAEICKQVRAVSHNSRPGPARLGRALAPHDRQGGDSLVRKRVQQQR